ncbi:MAG: DUF1572 family protein [Saprospiraceae bacterium]
MSQLINLIVAEYKRRIFDESFRRIENCISRLNYDQVWQKPNGNSNSIGNLVLHLMGNVRQYICSGIGGQKDIRQRHLEFISASACDLSVLYTKMAALKIDTTKVIDTLTEEKLVKTYMVQGFEEKGLNIVIHVIEHFSCHVGQIAQYTKILKNEDLGFYSGLDLNVKS